MATLNQFYKGEDIKITVKPTGDSDFNTETDCAMYVFPDTLDMDDASEENKSKIQKISYPSGESDVNTATNVDDTIVFKIPYTVTTNMEQGDYNIELRYGSSDEKTIIRSNHAFVLVSSSVVIKEHEQ